MGTGLWFSLFFSNGHIKNVTLKHKTNFFFFQIPTPTLPPELIKIYEDFGKQIRRCASGLGQLCRVVKENVKAPGPLVIMTLILCRLK